MAVYLLDTDIVIYYVRGQGNVTTRFLATDPAIVAISTITLYELEVGIAKSAQPEQRLQRLSALVESVLLLPFDEAAARRAGQVRASLEKQGTPIGAMDYMIAGIALANNAILVTHNLAEFSRVADLVCEDWF